jgi:spore coat protein H
MFQRDLVGGVVLVAAFGFVTVPETHARPSGKPAKGERVAAGLFGLDKVWQVQIELPAAEFEKMQPAGGPGGVFGGPQQAKPADPNADVHKGGGFGVAFPYGKGSVSIGPEKFANVGLRYKGNASYMASRQSLKRSMKVELDHFNENGPRFHELKKLNLNAGAMDPTKGREALAFAAYRAAGIPSPRTAYAEVTLTVPGKYDREYLGLYTVIEQVDKSFLKDRFGSNKGLLMKPERLRGIDYLGENWDAYKSRYQPKHAATPEQAKRVIDFTRLVGQANDEQFAKEIGSYLDVDEFLRFLGTTAMLSNLDSVLTMGHNFYIYLNPLTNKLVFLPWDMDLSLAGFPMGGSPDQQMDLSLMHPYAGQNKLIDRLLAIPAVNEQYRKILKDLAATVFSKEKLLADIETIEKATGAVREKEAKAAANRKENAGGFGFGPGGGMFGRSPDLKTFVEKRTASITAQLSGESKGYTPTGRGKKERDGPPGGDVMFGGPPGGPGGFRVQLPRIGDVLPTFLQEMVAVTDAQKKQLADVQKEVDAKLDRILTADQKAQLKRMREAGPGGMFRGQGGPPPGP